VSRFLSSAVCVACIVSGCVSNSIGHRETARQKPKPTEQPDKLPEWDWACGIPRSVKRADLVPATIAGQTLTRLLGSSDNPDVRLASLSTDDAGLQIAQVAGKSVQNYEQLCAAAQRAAEQGDQLEVTVRGTGLATESADAQFRVAPPTLLAIAQRAAQSEEMLRVTEDGNPWILIRDGDVRCRITARVERESGLMQLVLSLGVVRGGAPTELPCEIRATCNGKPLRCLTVADALEQLYDPKPRRELSQPEEDTTNSDQYSFAAISHADDYQVPTNYKRLQDQTKRAGGLPALAVIPGTFYPGSPVLGDARALTAFVLQRQLCQPGDPDKIGWVIFSGESLKAGGTVSVAIDLGSGPRQVNFLIPQR
jgi:hypothetical protein